MPGGLVQIAAYGDQNLFLNGNPSLSFFRPKPYRRYNHFAMESIAVHSRGGPLSLSATEVTPLRFKLDHHADMISDCYIFVPLPDVWSGMDASSQLPFEFQWVPHLGFNMIHQMSLLINGVKVAEHTGEWMKLQYARQYDKGKQALIQEMVGHVPELVDPGNAFGRTAAYPNAVLSRRGPGMGNGIQDVGEAYSPTELEPSIRGRNLVIPLMFFFCDTPAKALPLTLLQSATVEVLVEFQGLNNLFTVLDTRDTPSSATVGTRIRPWATLDVRRFFSPPNLDGTPSQPEAYWRFQPHMEVNYIFLSSEERKAIAKEGQRSYLYREVRMMNFDHLTGNAQLPLEIFNLVTRLVVVAQRSDAIARNNGWDNYTDWEDTSVRPLRALEGFTDGFGYATQSTAWGAGYVNRPRDIIRDMAVLMQGQPGIQEKPVEFWRLLQPFRYNKAQHALPGVLTYSFELDSEDWQPSGSFNASVIDKVHLKLGLPQPPLPNDPGAPPALPDTDPAGNAPDPTCGPSTRPTLGLTRNMAFVNPHPSNQYSYTYMVRVYMESYNILHCIDGTAAPTFAR